MRWILVALVLLVIVVDVLTGISGGSLVLLAGMGLVYAGERLFSEDALHWAFTGGGVLIVLLALALRARRWASAVGNRKDAERRVLIFAAIAASSLLLYALTTDGVTNALFADAEAQDRWQGVWGALFPIVWLVGLVPMVLLDRALAAHPRLLPLGAARRATEAGLAAALGVALVFPVNYLAANHVWKWDVAYFRVAQPGTSTLAIVRDLDEPIEAFLFFSPGSDVGREIQPYFDELEAAGGDKFVVNVVDQAVEPKLAEDLGVRENGHVVLRRGENTQKFKVGTEMDKARRELKKLDATVQKHLLRTTSDARTAYMVVGHGEANSKERDHPLRKLTKFKSKLEEQNYKVKNLGVVDGLSDAVPEDAGIVVIAAPTKPLLPEEEKAILDYLNRGGRLLVMVEPGGDPLPGILGHLGLRAGEHVLANDRVFFAQTRSQVDHVLLLTNRYGTHKVTETLSKRSQEWGVLLPTAVALFEEGEGAGKRTVLVRSMDDTWQDTNGDLLPSPEEARDVFHLAYAVSGPSTGKSAEGNSNPEFRAIVIGDVSGASDAAIDADGNEHLLVDGARWLIGDEEYVGDIESEEDVKIDHTRDEDVAWFYGTIFAVPLFVVAIGIVFTSTRRRKA